MSNQLVLFGYFMLIFIGITIVGYSYFSQQQRRKRFIQNSDKANSQAKQSYLQQPNQWLDRITQIFDADKEAIQKKFYSAGFLHFKYAHLYMPMKYIILVLAEMSLYALSQWAQWSQQTVLIMMVLVLLAIIILPDALLQMKTKSLQAHVSNQLPYLLDLMGVCVQTGMTIESAMSYLSKEMESFDPTIAHFLEKINDRSRIIGLDNALDEFYEVVSTNEVRSFVMTLKQSLQYGTSIYDVLTTLAMDIREVQMLDIEEKIGKLAAKMSIPLIVFIMIPIVILIAAPGVMRMMANV